MASSKQDGPGSGGPARSSGRTFAAMDPERQPEIVVESPRGAASYDKAARSFPPPARVSAAGRRAQQADTTTDEGGSGRRHR